MSNYHIMKSLILVESPAKCNKILSFLDNNYLCEATYGHLREIKTLKNINDKYEIEFTIMDSKKKQIDKIKKKLKQVDEVILATDDDREGEGIAWHVTEIFNLPLTTKRIKFNSITKDAILSALNNPLQLDMNMVHAQQGRQILDLLVGFKISPILWNDISRTSNLSAGRCQTPALNILYDNHQKIKDSIPEMSYATYGYFTDKNIKFTLTKVFNTDNEVTDFLNNEKGNDMIYGLTFTVKRNIEKNPPKPFITSSLQQSCNNVFNISPKECMSICQQLYESGHITYMRTDSYFINPKFKEECKSYITGKYGSEYNGSQYFHNKNSQEAHEAIRPTNILSAPELSGKLDKVYNLIRKQTLKSLMSNAIINNFKFVATKNNNQFTYSCDEVLFKGWTIIDNNDEDTYLHFLKNINKVVAKKISCEPSFTNVSLHYTEARLIKELEDKNIGRPSTFASIVEKIKERKYVLKTNIEGSKYNLSYFELIDSKINHIKKSKIIGAEKNKLVIQPLGILVITNLMKNFNELFKYDFTEEMESSLDLIADGEKKKFDICNDLNDKLTNLITSYNSHEKQKMMIDPNHEFIIGKNGPVIKSIIDGKTTFKKIIDNFDIAKIKNGEYNIDELIDNSNTCRNIGIYNSKNIILKKGKFGNYIEYGDKKISLRTLVKNFDDVILSDVIDILDNDNNSKRVITNEISIRTGKYGDYIFYKSINMKKPKFINIKKFSGDYMTCDKNDIIDYIDTYK